MAAYETASAILSDTAVDLGLGTLVTPYASTEAHVVQLRRLLTRVGRALTAAHPWLQCVKEATLTTVAGQAAYPLPADFLSLVDGTAWNRTNVAPLQAASPQAWAEAKARQATGASYAVLFRPGDTTLQLGPTVTLSGESLAYEYRSRLWARATGSTSPDKDAPTLDTDVVHLEAELVKAALRLAFLEAKGFDSAAARAEYEAALDAARSTNTGASPTLSLTGGCSEALLDMSNAPATGYGFDGGGLF